MALVYDTRKHRVFTKAKWEDEWELQTHLYADSMTFCAAPEIPEAVLSWHYGEVKRYTASKIESVPKLNKLRHFVKIELDQSAWNNPGGPFTGETVDWHGVIVGDINSMKGAATGEQKIRCLGLEWLLGRVHIHGSYFQGIESAEEFVQRAIAFNMDEGSARFQPNRSTNQIEGTYVFCEKLNSADAWTAEDIVKYVLKRFSPRPLFSAEPKIAFRIDPAHDFQLNSLDWWKIALEYHGRTVKEVLDSVLDRRRLMSYTLSVVNDEVLVQPFTFARNTINLPNGGTIRANLSQTDYAFDDDPRVQGSVMATDIQSKYDVVIARGERIGVVWTMSHVSGEDNGLEEDWDSTLQSAYNTGSSSAASATYDYDKVQYHRNYRATDKFQRVYRYFRVPFEWSGNSADGERVAIRLDDGGFVSDDKFWRTGLRIEPYLPLRTDTDYETISEGGTQNDDTPDGSLPEFRRPFAVYSSSGSSRYFYLDRPESAQRYGADPEIGEREWACSVRPQEDGFGVVIDVRGAPQHVIAKDEFSPADTADENDWNMDASSLRWQDIKCTVCTTLDCYVRSHWPNLFDVADSDALQVLYIDVPGKRAFYVVADTVVDVNADGTLKKSGGGWIENDREELEDLARLAYEWYATERRALDVTIHSLDTDLRIGTLVKTIGTGANQQTVNSVVTQIHYDFTRGTHTVRTQFAELDFARL